MKLGFPRILVTRFEVGFMQHLALRQISRIPTCLVQTTLFCGSKNYKNCSAISLELYPISVIVWIMSEMSRYL